MNFKSFIANSAQFHVGYLGSLLISVSQSIGPIIIASRDWLSWLAADDEISAHRQWLGGVGRGAGCVSPSQWHWMIRRVRGAGRGKSNILLDGEYLGVVFVFREALIASYDLAALSQANVSQHHNWVAQKIYINHWTNTLLTHINFRYYSLRLTFTLN